jgi:hypothetical protein
MAKKAVLVGINRYRIPGADLRGCVNDVRNIETVLTRHYGFVKSDIKILTDYEATKKAMQAAIRALITDAKKGDVLLLHYSGHGSNVPDKDGDEADQRDEILCPTDLDWKDPLTDDWLRKSFDKLKPGVSLTVIMDCCHSGSNTRAIQPPDAPRIARYLPNPWDIMAEESGRKLRGNVGSGLRTSSRAQRRRTDIVDANICEILLTGCRDTQTSADAYIGGSYNGALTYHLVDALNNAQGEITCQELHSQTLSRLKKANFEQVPQLECRKASFDRPFLSAA